MTDFKRTTGLLALAACLLVAGCGSDDEGQGIPRDAAVALDRQLDSIQGRFEFGGAACNDITGGDDPNTTAVERTINGLPEDVDADVRDALEDGFARLFQLVDEQCEPPRTETEPETVTEEAPPPTETQTETAPPPETTETTPPPTETEAPPPTETAPAPDEGGGAPSEGGSAPTEGGSAPGEGGSGPGGQGGDGSDAQGGTGGGAIVPEGQG
jgi:hypothetical protein